MTGPGDGVVLVFRQDDGRWRWSWSEGPEGAGAPGALVSNEWYHGPEEAESAAREAYPAALVRSEAYAVERATTRRRGRRIAWLALAAVAVVAARALARREQEDCTKR